MEPFRLDVIYVNKMSETFSKCALHVNLDIMYVKADIHAYVNAYWCSFIANDHHNYIDSQFYHAWSWGCGYVFKAWAY